MKNFVSYKYRLISLILLSVCLFSAVSLCIVRIVESTQQKKHASASLTIEEVANTLIVNDTLDIDYALSYADSVQTDEGYSGDLLVMVLMNNSKIFTVDSYRALSFLASLISKYEGFTIKLTDDIDCGGNSISFGDTDNAFSGTFDGCGHTISNVSLTENASPPNDSFYSVPFDSKFYGFFLRLSSTAIIKNLRLYNCGRGEFSGAAYSKFWGGLVGFSENAQIINCAIEGLYINETTDKTQNLYLAGIFACGSARITDCYVKNLSINGNYGSLVAIGPAQANGSIKIVNNVAQLYKSNYKNIVCVNSGTSLYITKVQLSNPTRLYVLVEEGVNSSNCYTESEKKDGLDCENVWYYNRLYNDKYPCLQTFTKLATFEFDTDGDGDYDTIRKIHLELKDSVLEKINSSSKVGTLNFYDYGLDNVLLGDIPAGKYFNGWVQGFIGGQTIDGFTEYGYKAKIIDEKYQVRVNCLYLDGGWVSVIVKTDTEEIELSGNKTYDLLTGYINYGDEIIVSVEYKEKKCYVSYTIGDISLTYIISGGYCLDNYGNLGTYASNLKIEERGTTVPDMNNNNPVDITPVIKEKTYSPNFG